MKYMAEFSYAEYHIKEELGNDKSDQNFRALHQFKSLYFDTKKCIKSYTCVIP